MCHLGQLTKEWQDVFSRYSLFHFFFFHSTDSDYPIRCLLTWKTLTNQKVVKICRSQKHFWFIKLGAVLVIFSADKRHYKTVVKFYCFFLFVYVETSFVSVRIQKMIYKRGLNMLMLCEYITLNKNVPKKHKYKKYTNKNSYPTSGAI